MDISKRILQIRGKLSREKFAAMIGVSTRTIQRWEQQNDLPKGKELLTISKVFNINTHWLLTGKGSSSTEYADKESENLQISSPKVRYLDDALIDIDATLSYQKLAALLGVKIGPNWVIDLGDKLKVPAWNITMDIHHDQIPYDTINTIEQRGYKPEDWIAQQERTYHNGASQNSTQNKTELLKMAGKILESNTAYSVSLAMDIISLNKAVETDQLLKEKNKRSEHTLHLKNTSLK